MIYKFRVRYFPGLTFHAEVDSRRRRKACRAVAEMAPSLSCGSSYAIRRKRPAKRHRWKHTFRERQIIKEHAPYEEYENFPLALEYQF